MVIFMNKFIVLFFVFSLSLFAQNDKTDWLKVHNLTLEGIDYLYNMNFDEASKKFSELQKIVPNDPRGYFFNAIQYYFLFSIERKKEYYNRFFDLSEKVIKICENLIEQNENDYNSKFYLAGIYGYRGIMYQLDNSIVKAVWDGKKGFSLLKQIVKEKPDLYDAYLGTGLFDYLLAKIPKAFSWILSALGYSGSIENGLKQLKIAEEKGVYTKQEARFYLSQFLLFEKRYDEAFYYIKKLIKEYPENSLFLISYANMESRIDKPEFAIEPCKKAIEINKKKNITSGDDLAYIVLANAYFLLNDFYSASEYYEIYLKKVPKDNLEYLLNYNFFQMGLSNDFSGKRDKAIESYKMTKKVSMEKRPWDALFYIRAQYFINNVPNENYKKIVIANNYLKRKKTDEALKEYLNIISLSNLREDEKIVCYFNIGEIYLNNKNLEQSQKYFDLATKTKPTIEKYLIPYAYYKLGKIALLKKDYFNTKEYFNKAKEFENYPYEESIRDSIKIDLKKIPE